MIILNTRRIAFSKRAEAKAPRLTRTDESSIFMAMRLGAIVRAAIYACHERVRVESFGSEGAHFFYPANTLSYTLKDAEEILSLHTGRTDVIPMKLTAVLIHRLRARVRGRTLLRATIARAWSFRSFTLCHVTPDDDDDDDGFTSRHSSSRIPRYFQLYNRVSRAIANISRRAHIPNLRLKSIVSNENNGNEMRACELIASFPLSGSLSLFS